MAQAMMKGVVFLGGRKCEVREFPVPEPGRDEALVRIQASGVCGSDLHTYRSNQNSPEQIRGHEPCGIVESAGADVVRVKPGDRVAVPHHQGCGTCHECASGNTVFCPDNKVYGFSLPGSFAEFMVAKERNCITLPERVSYADGAFIACVGGTVFAALRRLEAEPHQSVAVFGLGPVGLSGVLVAKKMGLRAVGIDVVPERVELARQCGADEVIDARGADVAEQVRAFSRAGGVDLVLETSGSAGARSQVLPSIRRRGKIAILGVGSQDPVINPGDIHGKAATLIGSLYMPMPWAWDLARYCADRGLSFEPAVTHRFPIGEAEKALQVADEAKCGKVLLVGE